MIFQFTLKDLKSYIAGREKAEKCGEIIILKNNQPNAAFLSIAKYKRLLMFVEYLGSLEEKDIAMVTESFPREGNRKRCTLTI